MLRSHQQQGEMKAGFVYLLFLHEWEFSTGLLPRNFITLQTKNMIPLVSKCVQFHLKSKKIASSQIKCAASIFCLFGIKGRFVMMVWTLLHWYCSTFSGCPWVRLQWWWDSRRDNFISRMQQESGSRARWRHFASELFSLSCILEISLMHKYLSLNDTLLIGICSSGWEQGERSGTIVCI